MAANRAFIVSIVVVLQLAVAGAALGQQFPYTYSHGHRAPIPHSMLPLLASPPAGTVSTANEPPPAYASYPSVTLDECVQAATPIAPNILIAKATLDSAQAQFAQVRASNGLALNGTGSYAHTGNLPDVGAEVTTPATVASTLEDGDDSIGENVNGAVTLSGPSTSASVSAHHLAEEGTLSDQLTLFEATGSQQVFDGYPGGRAAATIAQGAYTLKNAQVTYNAALRTVKYQVEQDYYTLLGDENTVQADIASVEENNENLKRVQAELSAQIATALDVLQAQVTLVQSRLNVRTAENTVDTDRKTLSLAIGWPIDKLYQVTEVPPPAPPTLNQAQALKIAYDDRPELQALELEGASADVNLGLEKAQFLPIVSAQAGVSLLQDWSANSNLGTYSVGGEVTEPIFESGLRVAQVQAANDQIRSYAVQLDQERQSITIAVDNALFGVTDAKNRQDLASQSLDAAQGQYNLERSEFAVGLATNLDVLTALSALTTAQVALQQARSTYALAVLSLINSLGL